VGSGNAVIKYDANLVLLSSVAVPFRVYDVAVSYGGNVVVCGATGDNSVASRTGYVQQINMSSCVPMTLVCCDLSICPIPPVCSTAAPFNISAVTAGGTWSGTGITNAALGTFSPAVSGAGTFTISYALACGTGTVSITVTTCATLSVCQGAGGTATASGGVGPYTWQSGVITNPCVAGVGFCSAPFTVAGPPVTTWTTFSTSTTATLPGTYPIQVIDANGNIFTISNAAAYAALTTCVGCPPLTVNISSQVNVACFGASTGSFNASTTGGVSPWNYTLMNGATTVATFINVAGTQSFTGLPAGTYTLNVTDHNGCPGTATITITQPASGTTVAAAGPNQTVCGTTATLAGNTATVGTGTWTLVSGAGTITTPTSPTSGITGLGAGANVFQWTISNPPCPSTTSTVTITGVTAPTTSVAGPNQTVCGTTATLAGNSPTTGTGLWTLVSGAGTITSPSSPTSGITGLGTGANVFQWTISNAPCPSSSSTVTITGVAAPTVANAGPNQTVCSTSATLAGNTATIGTGTWTLVSGAGTITTPGSPTSTVTGLGLGANVFQWTISNPPCPSTSSTVTITSTGGATTSAAGPPQSVCGTSATLAGNTPTVGSGLWTLVSGTGTITTPTSPTSGVTGLGIGPNVFQWTISSAPCPPSTSTVTITGIAPPTVSNAGPGQSVCSSSATLAGNTPATGTGTWTLVSGTGTITTPGSPSSGVTGLGLGANIFQWTIDNPPCTPSTDTVTIINTGGPTTSVAGTNQTVCGTTATLAGNTPTTGSGLWTLVSGTGTITSPTSPTSGVTGLSVGPNVFQWTISSAPCPPSSSTVTITGVATPTIANAGPNQTLCNTFTTLAGNTPTTGTGTWTLVSGAGTITTPGSPTSGVTGLGAGANVFQWTISNAPCPPSSATVTITNTGGPTVTITSQTNVNCNSSSTGSAAVSASGGTGSLTYSWTGGAGSGSSATSLAAGTYIVTVTDSAGCSGTASVTITQPAAITAGVTTSAATCGSSDGSATVTAGGGTGSYTYNWSPGSPTGDGTNTITNLSAGNYTVTITDSLGCIQSATGSVGSVGGPAVNAGADVTITSGGNTVLTGVAGAGATYSWAPPGTLSCDTCASTVASPTVTTTYTLTVTLGGCSSSDTVTVFVDVQCGELFVPNVFSPNGDNENDILKVYGNCITNLEFVVYDRWGEKVFETNDPAKGWDGTVRGKKMDTAVFVYYLNATVNGAEVKKHGNITLVK
ncbi:MAG: T9SS type B sorting domain-containing protein, partial [Bacteroidia bacterium]